MKKLILLMAASVAFTAQAQDIMVSQEHKTIVMKWTADWCPPCGDWGWTWFDDLKEKSDAGTLPAVVVAVHGRRSDKANLNLNAKLYPFEENLTSDIGGVPSFIIGNFNNDWEPVPSIKKVVKSQTETDAEVGAGFMPVWEDESIIRMDIKTTFFADAEGIYSVAAYFYENDVLGKQASQTGTVKHHNIFRSPKYYEMESGFGTQLQGGPKFTKDQSFTHSFSFEIPSYVHQENLVPFVVIWKQNAEGKWEVANASSLATWPTAVANVNNAGIAGIYPNPVQDKFVVAIGQQINTCNIQMYDITGKKVADLYNGTVAKNAVSISLDRPQHVNAGTYMVKIHTDKGDQTVKVVLQ